MILMQKISRFRSKMLIWLALGTGCLLVMLTHQSTPVEYLGRYSQRYVLLLAFVMGTVLAAAVLYILSRTQRLPAPTVRFPMTRAFGWLVVIVAQVVKTVGFGF